MNSCRVLEKFSRDDPFRRPLPSRIEKLKKETVGNSQPRPQIEPL